MRQWRRAVSLNNLENESVGGADCVGCDEGASGANVRKTSSSDLAKKLFEGTSKPEPVPAVLVLEDGTMFEGSACGALGEVFGEICFNTSLEGYLEVITDPSYAGQICTMTYPQIGNYGVCLDDVQRDSVAMRGLVVRDMCYTPSNYRSDMSLPEFLREHNVVAIEGVDTRTLVRHVRDHGAMRAVLSTVCTNVDELLRRVRESESIVGVNLVRDVSCDEPHGHALHATYENFLEAPSEPRFKVVAYDCGVKNSILDNLVRVGASLTVVPWDTPAEDVLAANPDGVFLSNGPGDPEAVRETYEQVEKLLGHVPIFGICLGHQMICKAAGASFEKLKFGHRGGNQPVMNLLTQRVEISVQNHGFGIQFGSLGSLVSELSGGESEHSRNPDLRVWVERGVAPVVETEKFGRVQLTHVNLNDGTPEGVAFLDIPAFSVQYHPEASPGSTDSHYLFTAFANMMREWQERGGSDDSANVSGAHHLNIDIARDRLSGWNFASSSTTASSNTTANSPENLSHANSCAETNAHHPTNPQKHNNTSEQMFVEGGNQNA